MKSRLNLILLMPVFFGFMFFTSCEKDDLADPDGIVAYRDASSFTYSINPAQVGDSIVITYDALNDADCGKIHIQVSTPDGEDWMGSQPVEPDSGIATLLFIPGEPGDYRVRAKYTRTGKPSSCDEESSGWFESTELLIVEGDSTNGDTTDLDTCEASFTVDTVSCDSNSRMVVFTYVSDTDLDYVKIQGGLTSGLSEDATVTVDGGDFDVSQRKPGNSTNRIIKLEGSVEACVPVTITILWNSTNDGSYITGDWSATGSEDDLELEAVECE